MKQKNRNKEIGMKKIIAFLLVIILVISTFVVAENEQEYDNTVSRAEFARIVAGLLGLSEWFSRQGETPFVDVPIEHWASGYILSLSWQHPGIARGDSGRLDSRGHFHPNSNSRFRPDDAILVEEAIAMLVRALGYAPMARAEVFGRFPNNYAIVAERSGLTENIEFEFGEYATRDLIYKLINRALDVPLMWAIVSGGNHFFIADGRGDRPLWTLRIQNWNNASVYFDGWDFVILDEEYETEEAE